jgi:hypothetical protein
MSASDPPGPASANAASPGAGGGPKKGGMSMTAVAAIVVVIVIIVGGLGYYELVYKSNQSSPSSSGVNTSLEMGGFQDGKIVTFLYNGTNTDYCTPSMSVMFPGNSTAAAAATKTGQCEIGNANQTIVPSQVPQYILVPAFAGLSIFGVSALGANASGFATWNGTAVATDCGAAGTATACPDHPSYLYSPFFTAVEDRIGHPSGYGGLPIGVLPTPAHDHLLADNSPTVYPNIPWGTIVVLVLDPNIFPAQQSPTCTAIAPSNLSDPTGNCLTSYRALENAVTACSSSVAGFNSATKNPIWQTLVAEGVPSCAQAYIPGGGTMNLNSNLYIPFAVSLMAPPMWPS